MASLDVRKLALLLAVFSSRAVGVRVANGSGGREAGEGSNESEESFVGEHLVDGELKVLERVGCLIGCLWI